MYKLHAHGWMAGFGGLGKKVRMPDSSALSGWPILASHSVVSKSRSKLGRIQGVEGGRGHRASPLWM